MRLSGDHSILFRTLNLNDGRLPLENYSISSTHLLVFIFIFSYFVLLVIISISFLSVILFDFQETKKGNFDPDRFF